jgi:omega-amidase
MSDRADGFRLAVLQLNVTPDKEKNIENALEKIRSAVKDGAQVIVLPECFNSPYGMEHFAKYAEPILEGPTCKKLSAIAKELSIYLIGGSIIEKDEQTGKLHNTCTIWNPDGSLQATHRKIHLYDVEIIGEPNPITFKESSVLTPGNKMTIVTIFGRKIGIAICHDCRFEEMAKLYRMKGCDMFVYPSAFDLKTGALHWEIQARGRANDNQVYVVWASDARDTSAGYVAWGHSMIVDPWGQVIKEAGINEETLIADIGYIPEVLNTEIIFSLEFSFQILKSTKRLENKSLSSHSEELTFMEPLKSNVTERSLKFQNKNQRH